MTTNRPSNNSWMFASYDITAVCMLPCCYHHWLPLCDQSETMRNTPLLFTLPDLYTHTHTLYQITNHTDIVHYNHYETILEMQRRCREEKEGCSYRHPAKRKLAVCFKLIGRCNPPTCVQQNITELTHTHRQKAYKNISLIKKKMGVYTMHYFATFCI